MESTAPLSKSDVLSAVPSVSELDLSAVTSEIIGTPALMGCAGETLGMSTLIQLLSRLPTEAEVTQLLPCFSIDQLLRWSGRGAGQASAASASTSTPSPTPTVASAPKGPPPVWETRATALDAPAEGAWYDGPLFDAHMHMNGVTFDFQGRYTTDDVLRLMDRHNIQASVGFWLPPVMGRQSEKTALLDAIGETDHRLVNLMMPVPLDLGFSFGFLGFADGTYTRSLLEPWFPPNGPFDGFGEITYYIDKLQTVSPLDSQLDDVYPLVAESKGIVMVHPDASQSAGDYAQVMSQYPEIIFLFHGLPDKHGSGPDEQAAIRELLATYEGDNMYYSMDVAPLMHAPEIDDGGSIGMDSENGTVLADLVQQYGAQRLAEHVYSEYGQMVIDHPDRVLFGTDFLAAWHFQDAGSDTVIDFARRFIGLLPAELRDGYAYENSRRLFSRYLD